jgi:molybdopterin-containing oxidoreductase family iron-sulfur binding subunit
MPPVGGRQWRGLDALARDPAFVARATVEFPMLAGALAQPTERRGVLRLMAAGLALAGLTGCDAGPPDGDLIPPVRPAAGTLANGPDVFATAHLAGGYAEGIRVHHGAGRPVQLDGNPDHPASLGALDPMGQADLLGFYDPDRGTPLRKDRYPQAWGVLLADMVGVRGRLAQDHGAGFRLLTGRVTSPTLARQISALHRQYPEMRWHRWEPVSRDSVAAGAQMAYGAVVQIQPRLSAADVIVAFDSDVLSSAPGHLRFARDFASRRNPTRTARMSRVYAIEPTPTLIGLAADHRIPAGPRDLALAVNALAAGVLGGGTPADAPAWVASVVSDLKAAQGRAFIHAGPDLPPEAHALVHAMNEALGGRGATYVLTDPVEVDPVQTAGSMKDLIADMEACRVHTLVILNSNPVYTAPGFAEALKRVPFSLAMNVGPTETAGATHWSVPLRHPLEDWSDARAFDGSATILQPQAQPLFDAVSQHRLLGLLMEPSPPGSLDVVRQTWQAAWGRDTDQRWHDSLAAGLVPDTALPQRDTTLRDEARGARVPVPASAEVALLIRPDPHVWDGRYANNAWMQELPRPTTKLTWDNPLLLSPTRARALDVKNGDLVEVARGDTRLTLPAWVVPGQAPDCAIALMGFGRTDVGHVGEGVGHDVFPLTARADPPTIRKVGGEALMACTEHHDPIFSDAGEYVHHASLDELDSLKPEEDSPEHLYRRHPPGPAAWGMSIDLNRCIGCNACVVACMAENNVPVVGKAQVAHEREMHWLRIDRYYEGDPDNPEMLLEPMLCMQCEEAPCEVVCPVGATVHDAEGLNVMVYNRCVGTRFCSNNCPYKVRRFNYFAFSETEKRPPQARNPEVTVRARGVMEKCTFCLQRIAAARIVADAGNRPVGADEVVTACQAACPTSVFSFGNMAEGGEVAERKKSKLRFALLKEQNTHPRVTYETKIRNRNRDVGA